MTQLCKVCKHADRQAIDAVLLEGWLSLRVIGAQYGVSKDSLLRHYRAHIPDAAAVVASQGLEEPAGLSRAVTEKEPDEARQVGEVGEEKKEPESLPLAELVERKKEPEPVEAWRPLTAAEIIQRHRQSAGGA
jgi:hypothetical protein